MTYSNNTIMRYVAMVSQSIQPRARSPLITAVKVWSHEGMVSGDCGGI